MCSFQVVHNSLLVISAFAQMLKGPQQKLRCCKTICPLLLVVLPLPPSFQIPHLLRLLYSRPPGLDFLCANILGESLAVYIWLLWCRGVFPFTEGASPVQSLPKSSGPSVFVSAIVTFFVLFCWLVPFPYPLCRRPLHVLPHLFYFLFSWLFVLVLWVARLADQISCSRTAGIIQVVRVWRATRV